MRIKWIELNGFKSFPDKTKIVLNGGLTCFVGPNGAGKSNIVDAFRWVLGEHNPRSLRGEKMEDIIFQGSQSKKERGLAEVTLILNIEKDCTDGKEPEIEEKEIKRRLYRTGESCFIINGKQSRLKDIKEIFLSEGVDIRTYSIIDQIKINEILFKPSQRKAILEECAGISMYKFKKTEAEIKLQSAMENLQRVEDLIMEIKKQLSLLEKMAKKAERYKKITEELKNLELKLNKKESIELFNELTLIRADIEGLEKKQNKLKIEIKKLIEKIEKQKEKITETEFEIQEIEKTLKQLEFKNAEMEKELALLIQEKGDKEAHLNRLEKQNQGLIMESEKLKKELQNAIFESEKIEELINSIQKEVTDEERILLQYQKQSVTFEGEIEKKRKTLFNLSTELADKKNYYQSVKRTLDNAENRINTIKQTKQETCKKLDLIEMEVKEKENRIQCLKETLENENSVIQSLQSQLTSVGKKEEEKNHLLVNKKKEEAVINGRIETIQSEIWDEDKKHRLFIECIDVNPELESAVESFLDEKLKASVIERIEEIEQGRQRKFYFLKNIPLKKNNAEKFVPDCRKLNEFIKIKEEGIDGKIFENVFIVSDIKKALELKKEMPDAYFITLNGETISPEGFIKTGKSIEFLTKKRILEKLKNERNEISNKINSLMLELEKIRVHKENLKKLLETKMENLSHIERQLIQTEESYKRIFQESESIKQKIKNIEKEEKLLNEEISKNKELIEELSSEIYDISSSIDNIKEELERTKNAQAEISSKNEKIKENLSQKRIQFSTLKEKLNGKRAEIKKLNEYINRLLDKRKKDQIEIERIRERIKKIEERKIEKNEKIEHIFSEIEKLKQRKEKLQTVLQNEKNLSIEFEKNYHRFNTELQNITATLGQKKTIEGEKMIKLENIWNEIFNRYGIDIMKEEIEPAEESESYKERISRLSAKLKETGPVDPEIIREYKEVKERYDFLTSQQKDLSISIKELQDAIKKINTMTKKRLRDTFDALNIKFNEFFNELFEGGRAELLLTEENSILESDMEIKVQPPGKKSNNINLLSGGEKTLIALAFIFACLSIRPSPVCILDEVDALLDEPNTSRFRKLVKSLSNKTQFLVITHNKLMMEYAEQIYGVTMQEKGVSTVISLNLSEAGVYS